jgi:hypothetical protein
MGSISGPVNLIRTGFLTLDFRLSTNYKEVLEMLTINQYEGERALAWQARTLAEKTIAGLASRRIKGLYFPSRGEAREAVLKMIPAGATVGFGGSVTLQTLGLYQAVLDGPYQAFNRYDSELTKEEKFEVERKALTADFFLSGVNAVTLDGRMVNVDGNGNRVAAMLFGPRKVIAVTGVNKIVANLDEAMERLRRTASPLNCARLNRETPCVVTGYCHNCHGAQSICNLTTIIEGQFDPERFTVVFIGESLGF